MNMKRLFLALAFLLSLGSAFASPRPVKIYVVRKSPFVAVVKEQKPLLLRVLESPMPFFFSPRRGLPQIGNPSTASVYVQSLGSDAGATLNAINAAVPTPPASQNSVYHVTLQPNITLAACATLTTPVLWTTPNKVFLLDLSGNCINDPSLTAHASFTLDYMPSTGTASWIAKHGIINGTLTNTQCNTNGGIGSLATAIQIGNTNFGAQRGTFEGLTVACFGTGFANGNPGSWGQNFFNNTWRYNSVGVALSAGPLENMMFVTNYWMVNGTGITNNGAEISLLSGGCDSNTGGILGVACYSDTTGSPVANFVSFHFENLGVPTQNAIHYINSGSVGQVNIFGGVALDDTAGGATRDTMFTGNVFDIRGLAVTSISETITTLVTINGVADINLQDNSPALIPLASVAFAGTGVHIHVTSLGNAPFDIGGIGGVPFANLPTSSANGTVIGCTNCTTASNPCTGASTGAVAVRQNGAWVCK